MKKRLNIPKGYQNPFIDIQHNGSLKRTKGQTRSTKQYTRSFSHKMQSKA